MNSKALAFFQQLADSEALSPASVKLAHNSDFTQLDADFILKCCDRLSLPSAQVRILDIGSGTGLIINKLYPFVQEIVAVDKFPEFTKFICSPPIKIIHDDLFHFQTSEQFDLVTLFATMHYFDTEEAGELYLKFSQNVKPGGMMIIKNQFGIKEDVTIDQFSEEQKRHYYSVYRTTAHEIELLKKCGCFMKYEVEDIYPPECNRWENTHFYAITAVREG